MIVLAIIISYLLGSVPTGLWLGLKLRGIDIREHGSKNIGATNTMRTLGKKCGAAALAVDVAKGLVPVLLVSRMSAWEYAPLACGVAAIMGHMLSIFVKFKGGKGVATSLGAFLGLCPTAVLIALGAFIVVVLLTRMVSAGSVLATVAFTIAIHAMPNSWPLRTVVTIIALLVVIKHRTNIQRIFRGEEGKL